MLCCGSEQQASKAILYEQTSCVLSQVQVSIWFAFRPATQALPVAAHLPWQLPSEIVHPCETSCSDAEPEPGPVLTFLQLEM
jgi:hypothetical protein